VASIAIALWISKRPHMVNGNEESSIRSTSSEKTLYHEERPNPIAL
jgi:hypothetical protein